MVTKRNKILIAGISTAALLIGGISFATVNKNVSDDKKQTKKSTDKNDSKTSRKTNNKNSSKNDNSKGNWTTTKQGNLSNFMKTWQKSMNQEFDGTYDGKQPNHYGIIFPEHIISLPQGSSFEIDGNPATLHWNPSGEDLSGNAVVAVATGWVTNTPSPNPLATYFFTISNGQPIVYVTRTNNGEILYLTKTENADLQKGFEDIYYQ